MFLEKLIVFVILCACFINSGKFQVSCNTIHSPSTAVEDMDYVKSCEFASHPVFQLVVFNVLIAFIVWRNMEGGGEGAGGGGGGGAETGGGTEQA
ncbi:homeobox protein Hox-D11-like [Coccinella septempunctata]|uniref:homeobox protein Hox-D11-like n=1 Tax=Coccinella septempunctata TaxID=41139 RepID=UPI001D082248|nr:homeobox protein Hox-D11-like [Coccinella septempunctata]